MRWGQEVSDDLNVAMSIIVLVDADSVLRAAAPSFVRFTTSKYLVLWSRMLYTATSRCTVLLLLWSGIAGYSSCPLTLYLYLRTECTRATHISIGLVLWSNIDRLLVD